VEQHLEGEVAVGGITLRSLVSVVEPWFLCRLLVACDVPGVLSNVMRVSAPETGHGCTRGAKL
jgi:hypothetical protein